MKCSCDAERYFNSDTRHLAMNASGISTPTTNTGAFADNTGKLRVRFAPRWVRLRGSNFQLPRSSLMRGAGSAVDGERSSLAQES